MRPPNGFFLCRSVIFMTQRFDWRTDVIRFSFLGCTDEAAEAINWYALTGKDPESETRKKSLGTRNEEGPWGPGLLTVAAQSGRVDILLTPIQPSVMPKEPPHLGSLPKVAEELKSRVLELKLPNSARLAIGAQISLLAESSKDAVKLINKLASYADFKESLTDIVCQYNEPKRLKHSGIEFNRLFKWTQARIQYLQFGVGPDGKQIPIGPGLNAQHLVQLELDFNTSPNTPSLHQGGQVGIIKEMFEILVADGHPQGE